jgi:hypothetical protein
MKYLAHLKNSLGDFHNLDDHLRCVGELAEKYIREANTELAEQEIAQAEAQFDFISE